MINIWIKRQKKFKVFYKFSKTLNYFEIHPLCSISNRFWDSANLCFYKFSENWFFFFFLNFQKSCVVIIDNSCDLKWSSVLLHLLPFALITLKDGALTGKHTTIKHMQYCCNVWRSYTLRVANIRKWQQRWIGVKGLGGEPQAGSRGIIHCQVRTTFKNIYNLLQKSK